MPPLFEWRATRTDVVLRAMAIASVVFNHTRLVTFGGGAAFLLMLSGMNFARFAIKDGTAPGIRRSILDMGRQVFVPSLALVLLSFALYRKFDVLELLFVRNWYALQTIAAFPVWWVQMFLQLLAGLYLLLWIPAIVRGTIRRPALAMLVFFGVGLFLRAAGALLTIPLLTGPRLPLSHLWTFALGAVVYFCAVDTTTSRSGTIWLPAACVLAGTIVGFDFGTWQYWWVTIAGLLLVRVKYIPLPHVVARVTTTVSAATFGIFLTHMLWFRAVSGVTKMWAGPDAIAHPLVLFFFSLLLGTATFAAFVAFGRAYRALQSEPVRPLPAIAT